MSQMVITFDSAMSPLLSAIHNTGHTTETRLLVAILRPIRKH